MRAPAQNFTALLSAHQSGDTKAWNELFELVYGDMRIVAANILRRERSQRTIQATALVHETYLRLIDQESIVNRPHFFAIASTLMRRILVDGARRRLSNKRGGGVLAEELSDTIQAPDHQNAEQIIELNDLIEKLAAEDPRAASICEMRFFVGLELEEIAEKFDISLATVKRDLTFAKAWLKAEL